MTRLLDDILRQPGELLRTIDYLGGAGRKQLSGAAAVARQAQHVYVTGIGSSFHAALTAGPLFSQSRPVYVHDAAELLQFAHPPRNSVIIAISRTGRSLEIVQLLHKAREYGAVVIGVTNSANGPLAQEAQIPIIVPVGFDHGISVNTYSTLAAATGILASATVNSFDDTLAASLSRAVAETTGAIACWRQQISDSAWFAPGTATYFLARGSSLGSCHEARLLWEEGVKAPATAMGSSSFRHGPQEAIRSGYRFGIWIDGRRMRGQDLAVAHDLERLGASVMLIGQKLPEETEDLVFQLPDVPSEWQFLVDIIPAQLAAEHLARLSGVDCDSFRYCSYIVENEGGLLPEKVGDAKK